MMTIPDKGDGDKLNAATSGVDSKKTINKMGFKVPKMRVKETI